MKIVFDCLHMTDKTLALVRAGEPIEQFEADIKNFFYKRIMLDGTRIETALPHPYFQNHTTLTMYNGDELTVKYSVESIARVLDHIDANKLLCRLRN